MIGCVMVLVCADVLQTALFLKSSSHVIDDAVETLD